MATTSSSSNREDTPSPTTTANVIPSSLSTEAFFLRHSLSPARAFVLCHSFVATHYPDTRVYPCPNQGYCSYTLCVGEAAIIQFRPQAHRLNTALASLAREIYGVLAPLTHFLGIVKSENDIPLYVYCMTRIPGLSLAQFRQCPVRSAGEVRVQRSIIVRDFARFLSVGWNARRDGQEVGGGRLGGSLKWRCEKMRDGLPVRFRVLVEEILQDLDRIKRLPWVLTHGDVNPGNVMVEGGDGKRHSDTGWRPGSLRGLVDWSESEYLPFGVSLYGAEELFGQNVRQWERAESETKCRFAYYPTAGDLRRLFWEELENAIPALADYRFRNTVEQARRLGILLWHGFAFDDGRLDRVVQVGRDDEELQRLDMFLLGTDRPDTMPSPHALLRKATTERLKEDQKLRRGSLRAFVRYMHVHIPGL